MISEIDLRDWDKIDCDKAREYVDSLDDICKMGVSINPYGTVAALLSFISEVEIIKKKQCPQVAALLKKGD